MKKILPIDKKPIIQSYSTLTSFLGIMNAHDYDTRALLYNNFLTLSYAIWIDYIGYPQGHHIRQLFKFEKIKHTPHNLIKYIKEQISQEHYISLVLNAKHIADIAFNREWYHDWMLYGYDDADKYFFALGFDVDTSCHALQYKQVKISYDELLSALPQENVNTRYAKNDFMNNHIFWLPKEIELTPLKLQKIKRDTFMFGYNLLPFLFNANIYYVYTFMLRRQHKSNEISFDLRNFKMLTEHKKIVLQMMTDLIPNSQAAEQYKAIQSLSNTMLMTALKYNMTKKNKQKSLETICNILKQLRKEEPPVFRTFYKELKAHEKEQKKTKR